MGGTVGGHNWKLLVHLNFNHALSLASVMTLATDTYVYDSTFSASKWGNTVYFIKLLKRAKETLQFTWCGSWHIVTLEKMITTFPVQVKGDT